MSEQAITPERTANGHRPLEGFTFRVPKAPPGRPPATAWQSRRARKPSFLSSLVEIGVTLTGVGLSLFMFMHLGLLSTSIIGEGTMNDLANFLEKYYLLHAAAPVLIIGLVLHIVLSLRRAPTTFKQQVAIVRQVKRYWHLDTWTWMLQLVTGLLILVFAAIHLWVILTDLPIEAAKSGDRVNGVYLGIYIPFVLAVESHISVGLYRVLAKWGLVSRLRAHLALSAWTVVVLALGFTILATFFNIGGGS